MTASRSRPSRWRRKLAGPLALVLVASLLAAPAVEVSLTTAPAASAVEPPQGGLVDSVAGFGRTQGEFSVSDDGAALYELPLWTPEGRGEGIALGLSYNSNGGNGLVGVGWSLAGLSSIAWCSRTIAQDGYTDGGHVNGWDALCLDGNRLMPTTPAGQPQRTYRTEEESFARITAFGADDGVPDYFRVESKDGLINTYGQTADARMTGYRVPRDGSPQVSVAWALHKIEDRNGNSTTIEYYQEHGSEADNWFVNMRPKRITYPPNRRIEFVYKTRPDVLDGFLRGVHTRTTHLLDRVDVFGGRQGGAQEKLREHRMTYANYSITGRSLLTQVVDCDGRGVCMRPLDLQWTAGGYDVEEIGTDIGGFSGPGTLDQLMVGDIGGDGRDDIVYQTLAQGWLIRHSTGDGFGAAVTAGVPALAFSGQKMRPIDFDRDGRMDIMAEVPDDSVGGTGWKLFRSNGLRFEPYSDNIGYFGANDHQLDPIYFADLNGDGLPDFITARWDFEPPQGDPDIDGPWRYRLNRGTEVGGRFAPEVSTESLLPAPPDENRVLDSDGDGRYELVGEDNVYPNKKWYALGLTASGGVERHLASLNLLTGSLGYRQHFADINGDGLADQFLTYGAYRADEDTVINGSLYASLGSGLGVGQSSAGAGDFDTQPEENATIVADFNNDGNDDLLSLRSHPFAQDAQQGAQLFVWRNGSLSRVTMPNPLLVGSHNVWEDGDGRESDYSKYKWRYARTLDIDGNGVLDIVHIKLDKLHVKKRKNPMPDRLVGVGAYGIGPRVEVDYTNLADTTVHTKATCAYPLACLNTGGTVVKEHRFATYQAAPQDWDRHRHTYEHARADMRGRGWLGFAKHTVTRTLDGTTKTTEFDNTTTDGGTDGVPVVYPYARLPKKTTTLVVGLPAGTGHTGTRERRHTVDTDNEIRRFGSRYTVEPQEVIDIEEERLTSSGAWQQLRRTTTTTVFDAYGNADYKLVVTAGGGRTLTEDTTFRNEEATWLIGFPERIATTSCTADSRCATRVVTQTPYPNGNLKQTIVEPLDPKLKLTTDLIYGDFGTVKSVTETAATGPGRVTQFEYDADMLYPTVTVNAAGHRSTVATQPGLSLPIAVTGPNGAGVEKITMRYDRFGRPRELYRGDGSSEIITHGTFLGAQLVTKRLSGGFHSTVITDWFDREYEREERAFDGRVATTYTSYDAFGRVSTVSRPTLPGETRYHTAIAYDRLDRPVQVTEPDATVRHEYIGREHHLYDGKGVHSYTVASPDGDVVASFEDDPIAIPWLETLFEYGPFGLPSKITAPDDTVQSIAYDTVGNQTGITDAIGSSTATYTAFGEVLTETDATGSTATYTHDALSRVTRVTSPDGVSTNTWDTAANGIGKLASSDSPDSVFTRHTYNELSQHTSTSWKIGPETFQFVNDYDQIGRLFSTTYPHVYLPAGYERLKVSYVYNDSGYLKEVRDAAAAPTTPAIWAAEARNGAGQLVRERMGNGALTTNEYTPVGLLSRTFTDGPATMGRLADISYGRDANRNVTSRQDLVNNRAEDYGYDTLNRMTSWRLRRGATDITTAYTYDAGGNLKTETAPGLSRIYHYGENEAPPNVLTGIGADHQRFTYDGAGRQLTAPRRTVTYNRSGLPKTLTYGQSQILREFDYDAAGARVRRTDAGSSISQITVGGLYERRIPPADDAPTPVGVEHVHNISVEGRIVAQVTKRQDSPNGAITASGVHYLHADAQGSIVRVSTRNGSPRTDFFYDPWGQRITADGQPTSRNEAAPRQGYASHEHDDTYGLINMRGRMYDPEIRRFLSTDPVISDPARSQSLNRYTYVRNNPATLTDPTGLDPAEGSSVCTLECPGTGPWKDLNPATLVIDPNGHPQEAGDQGQTKSDGDTATDKGKADPSSPNTPTCEDCAGTGNAVQVGDPAIADYYEQVAYSGSVDQKAAANLVEMANGIRGGSLDAPSETIMVVGADRSVLEKRESFGRSMAALEMAMGFVVEQACGVVTACDLIMTAIDIAESGFDPLTHTFNLLPLVKRPKFKPKSSNRTSQGFKRSNAKEWRKIRDSWDAAGFGDALSEANRKRIAKGLTPRVDDEWIVYFPGDAAFKHELISIHHIHGSLLTVPLTKSRHQDAHMPGGFGRNTGGPGVSG